MRSAKSSAPAGTAICFGTRLAVFSALCAVAGLALGAELVEFKPRGLGGNVGVGCDLTSVVPKDFRVLATSSYGGRESTQQIDQSGHAATEFDVAVHAPGAPVVLALAAYEPTIWRVGWSEKTRIVAVVASGYHRQIVLGLPRSVPVLAMAAEAGTECPRFGYFIHSGQTRSSELSQANRAMRAIVGRSIDRVYAPKEKGVVVLGEVNGSERFVTSNEVKLTDYVAADQPKAGRAGVEEAARRGVLRAASDADLEAAAASVQPKRAAGDGRSPQAVAKATEEWLRREARRGHVWVVQAAFTIPAGLYGAHSETFLLPPGVPEPEGNPGHSTVLRLANGVCIGPACPR